MRLHAEQPFDVLHAQYGYPPGLAVLQAARAHRAADRRVASRAATATGSAPAARTHKAAIRTVLDHAGAVLIGSASFRDEVVGHHGTDPARFRIVPGATDTARFTPVAAARRCSDPPVLLFHGRVDRRKGVLDLLEALPDGRAPASSAASAPTSTRRARAPTSARRSSATRRRTTRPTSTASADVFVSPTYSEGFSNTVLEAMASGLPVVSTSSVGVVDCLRHDVNGLLHEPGDVAGLRARARAACSTTRRCARRLAATALEEVRRLLLLAGARPQRLGRLRRARRHGAGPRVGAAGRRRPGLPVPRGAAPAVRVPRGCVAVSPAPRRRRVLRRRRPWPRLADAGHEVTVADLLHRAACPDPTGFALACQTDKGLAPGRRLHGAAPRRGPRRHGRRSAPQPVHLPLREAPHRGYDSAPALFAGVRAATTSSGRTSLAALRPYDADLWLAPQGLGGHVDHLQVVRAVAALGPADAVVARRAVRAARPRRARPSPDLPGGLVEVALPAGPRAAAPTPAPATRRSSGFQFGGEAGHARGAARLARAAARRPGRAARAAPRWQS